VLIENFPDENWNIYDNKPLVFYHVSNYSAHPFLYRGSLQKPEDAFVNGMKSSFNSKNIEDYAEVASESAGVSTSKSVKVASMYSAAILMNHYGVHEFPGWLYQVRGNLGIDIDETHKLRNSSYSMTRTKQEVNFVSHIPPEDIVGCGYKNEKDEYVETQHNPNYNPNKPIKNPMTKRDALRKIFKGDKDDMIAELEKYIRIRKAEVGTFIGYLKDFSRLDCNVKTGAAQNLINALNGDNVEFSRLHLDALLEPHSALGNIVIKYINNGLVLPPKILGARKAFLADQNHQIIRFAGGLQY
jgi:hypothetical protein